VRRSKCYRLVGQLRSNLGSGRPAVHQNVSWLPERDSWFTLALTTVLVSVDRAPLAIHSPEITRASLHRSYNWLLHPYALPFLSLYPLLAYAYYIRYDDWLKSEEWTFLACTTLGATHALSFLVTRWSLSMKAALLYGSVSFYRLWTEETS
jgi:hypothetical protein